MQAYDAVAVTGESLEAFSCAPVPDLDGAIHAAADEFAVVELDTSDAGLMAVEGSDLFACVDVPDFDSSIVGTGGEDVVVKLETHDAVCMSLKDPGGASPILPVRANLEAVFVDIFPRPFEDSLMGEISVFLIAWM